MDRIRRWLPKPSQLVLALGVFFALFTLASGILPAIEHWEDDSPIQREVFEIGRASCRERV